MLLLMKNNNKHKYLMKYIFFHVYIMDINILDNINILYI